MWSQYAEYIFDELYQHSADVDSLFRVYQRMLKDRPAGSRHVRHLVGGLIHGIRAKQVEEPALLERLTVDGVPLKCFVLEEERSTPDYQALWYSLFILAGEELASLDGYDLFLPQLILLTQKRNSPLPLSMFSSLFFSCACVMSAQDLLILMEDMKESPVQFEGMYKERMQCITQLFTSPDDVLKERATRHSLIQFLPDLLSIKTSHPYKQFEKICAIFFQAKHRHSGCYDDIKKIMDENLKALMMLLVQEMQLLPRSPQKLLSEENECVTWVINLLTALEIENPVKRIHSICDEFEQKAGDLIKEAFIQRSIKRIHRWIRSDDQNYSEEEFAEEVDCLTQLAQTQEQIKMLSVILSESLVDVQQEKDKQKLIRSLLMCIPQHFDTLLGREQEDLINAYLITINQAITKCDVNGFTSLSAQEVLRGVSEALNRYPSAVAGQFFFFNVIKKNLLALMGKFPAIASGSSDPHEPPPHGNEPPSERKKKIKPPAVPLPPEIKRQAREEKQKGIEALKQAVQAEEEKKRKAVEEVKRLEQIEKEQEKTNAKLEEERLRKEAEEQRTQQKEEAKIKQQEEQKQKVLAEEKKRIEADLQRQKESEALAAAEAFEVEWQRNKEERAKKAAEEVERQAKLTEKYQQQAATEGDEFPTTDERKGEIIREQIKSLIAPTIGETLVNELAAVEAPLDAQLSAEEQKVEVPLEPKVDTPPVVFRGFVLPTSELHQLFPEDVSKIGDRDETCLFVMTVIIRWCCGYSWENPEDEKYFEANALRAILLAEDYFYNYVYALALVTAKRLGIETAFEGKLSAMNFPPYKDKADSEPNQRIHTTLYSPVNPPPVSSGFTKYRRHSIS